MMNSFVYDIPVKVYFGENQLQHLGEELSKFGKRVLLTYGGGSIKETGLYDTVMSEIKKTTWKYLSYRVSNPIPVSNLLEKVYVFARMKR